MPKTRLALSVLVMALGTLVVAAPAGPVSFVLTVNTNSDVVGVDGFCCGFIREAVLSTNANADWNTDCDGSGYGPDLIILANGADITLNSGDGDIEITGTLTINGNSNPPPFQNTAVKGFTLGQRVFTVSAAGNVTFNDFVIQNAICNPGACDGAGVKVDGVAHFDDMSLGNNQAGLGKGGAIYNAGTVSLDNTIVAGNAAHGAAGGGGGIYNSGSLTLVDSRVTNNPSTDNGGGISNTGTLFITRSLINGHAVNLKGGGIYNNGGSATIANSTISGNFALEDGGGIYTTGSGSSLTVLYSTISNNTADYQANGTPGQGGGIFHGAEGTVNLLGTILAGNFDASNDPPDYAPDCSGSMFSEGYNLFGIEDNCLGDGALSDLIGTPLDPVDPELKFLSNYGGPTMTHMLLPSSPAVNAGEEEPCTGPESSTLNKDQRTLTRPQPSGGKCDMGAVEREHVAPSLPTLLKPTKRWQPDKTFEIEWTPAEDTFAPTGGVIDYVFSARESNYKARKFKPALVGAEGTTLTTSMETVVPGKTICYKVRSRDLDGNESPNSNERCTAVPANDRDFERQGKWRAKNGDDYYLNDYVQSRQDGATLLLKKIRKAKRMILVATKCPDCGSVKVFMAGDLLKKVSLAAPTEQHVKFIKLKTFPSLVKGTAKIEVTSKGKLVQIEGLGISKL